MAPPGEPDYDSILDSPDSPPNDQPQSPPDAVITLSSSPASPGYRAPSPVYSRSSSPCNMEVGQEHSEDYSIGGLLSPEKAKQTSYNEDAVFIFDEDMKFFEATKESFEAKVGNPELCQAIITEQPNQRRELLLELANLVKNLFRNVDLEGDDEERKFAIHNLQLHSKPCINHILDLVRTISSEEDLAVFQRNAGLEDKQVKPKDPVVSKGTERKLTFWNLEMDNMFRTMNNYVYEILKMNPKTNVNKTIQSARQAVAALAKENVMLKEQLNIHKESEAIYKEQNTAQLTSIEGVLLKHRQETNESSARMINMEQMIQTWTNRPPMSHSKASQEVRFQMILTTTQDMVLAGPQRAEVQT